METTSGKIHRRKSSKDDDEITLVVNTTVNEPSSPLSASISPTPTRPAPPPPRSPRSPLPIPASPSTSSSSSSHSLRSPIHARVPTSPIPVPPREYSHAQRSRVHSTPAPPPLLGHSRSMSISVPSPLSSPNGYNTGPSSAGLGSVNPPPSAGSYRTSFKVNGHGPPSSSPFRASISSPQNLGVNGINSHSRTRSISTPYSPPLPSPLSFSFPADAQSRPTPPRSPTTTKRMSALSASSSLPENRNTLSPSSSLGDATGQEVAKPGQGQESQNNFDSKQHNRRHSRLHSRNLSIFFPRPGSLPANSISEDGAQELEFPSSYSNVGVEALPMPSAGSSVSFPSSGRRTTTSLQNGTNGQLTPLGANFTFGGRPGRPPALSGPTTVPTPPLMSNGPSSASSTSSRRGHHHKHSLSHNFFSFLEPGAGGLPSAGAGVGVEQEQELYTQPTPTPMSPWNPISPFPRSAGMAPGSAGHAHAHSHSQSLNYSHFPPTPTLPTGPTASSSSSSDLSVNTNADIQSYNSTLPTSPLALPFTIIQFFLGAFLWVSGQQIGSLGTTGLGYWVVFDSLGVGVGRVLGSWLREGSAESGTSSGNGRSALRRPYGNARIETVLQFAQSVYLMFSSVYVCKETVEHVLLSAGSAGGGDGHHHHAGDEDPNGHLGIQFPYILAFISFVTITMSAMMFDNHKKLVEITGNRIPSISTLVRSFTSSILSPLSSLSHQRWPTRANEDPPPSSLLGIIISNPYVVFPLGMCVGIWWGGVGLDVSHHRTFDLFLAGIITFVTFRVSYSASVVLGTVLLQTAPRRITEGGNAGRIGRIGGIRRVGRMEAFLRAMKDVERHPQVLHLPAPHIWQFTPTPAVLSGSSDNTYNAKSFTKTSPTPEHLVVTLELHVRRDLSDEDVLKLTRWAWEKCVGALTGGVSRSIDLTEDVGGDVKNDYGNGGPKVELRGEMVKADVTVGVVRG
ncbi:hypothetical protein C8R41DRAFT_921203 [Lentinula lateritia]|uniref:Phosphatidic acid phosphatase type 2/haloperoxidase domain-containing protein n=1 Tax=Lentinula lateritia TaxID=40482 RepID=A0ABQ8VBV0_9AGAR|nr:hypothetical protein C8R41DRAFT_921203 [Lentinula lateritia]